MKAENNEISTCGLQVKIIPLLNSKGDRRSRKLGEGGTGIGRVELFSEFFIEKIYQRGTGFSDMDAHM